VEEGWVSPEAALECYGVSVAEQDGRVEGRRARG
jgi:hypothetical protein